MARIYKRSSGSGTPSDKQGSDLLLIKILHVEEIEFRVVDAMSGQKEFGHSHASCMFAQRLKLLVANL